MIGNRFYTWFKNYYQWVGGAFSETLLLPLVRATAGLRAGAIRYDETTNTVETYDGTNWNAIPSASGFVPNSRTITINGTTFDLSTNRIYSVGTVTSVGLSMPAAFTVSGSPVTGAGTLSVTGAGLATQYVRGDGTLANFPTSQGGGSSVSYYFNGSVNQGTFSGSTYYEMNRTPVLGAGTNFSRNTDGYIASFITDANDPALTEIPGGNFNLELYFSASSGGGNPSFYVELYKYDGTNFSLIASNSTSPDSIVGSAKDAYFTALAVPQTTLAITDRLAIRVYVAVAGRTITLHTEDQNLCQIITTFSTGINTINGLTKQVQFLTTGTSGTDFNINSTNSTHTFNIPTASATNRGALSSSDWTTFNNKVSTSRQLTINGTAFDLSADRSWSVGTVTSVAASAPLSVSGSATTTPVITISQANSTTNGFLSSTDWNTFNNKQNTLSLTTTGNSGASTLVGSTLNVPEYTISGLGGVPTSRTLTINGTAFDLSANRSWSVGTVTSVGLTSSTSGVTITDSPVTVSGTIGIAIATANGSQQGLLSSTDWTTFNNKQNTLSLTTNGTSGAATLIGATLNVPQYQAQGNYITSLTGEATASGPGAASVTLSTTAVTGKLLTGLNLSGGGTIAATDSILTAFGKVQNQISAMVGGVMYQGTWNASTNTPTLTSSVGVKGYYYIVDVSGTTNLNGITDWRVGDWAIFNGSTWDKVDNTDAVSSVNGFTGAVSLTTSHIAEGTNLYYLDSRSRTAISLTTTGNSGAATYDNVSGIINVPQYTLSGLGGVPTTRQLTINGTAFDLSADRSWSVGTVTSVGLNSTTSGITITNTPVTGSGALTINIATASGSQNGLLSSTDWTTFNNKQNALNGTGFVKISGTTISYDNSTYLTTGSAAATYVPYSGATSGVNLGTNNLLAANIDVDGNGVSSGGMLSIRQFSGSNSGKSGYSSIFALNQNLLGINFAQGLSANKTIYFDVANITNDISRTYQLPNAGGTIALTSNINSAVSGTTNYIPKFTGINTIGNSALVETSGNLGLGVTPSAWGGVPASFELGNSAYISSQGPYLYIGANTFFNGTNSIYKINGHSTVYAQDVGRHIWFTAPSGTAGNAITFTQAMTLDASGNLLVKTPTNPYGIGSLVVNHNSTSTRSYFQRGVDLIEIAPSDGTLANLISSSFTIAGSAYKPLSISARQNYSDLHLTTDGRMGIGTISPATRFNVVGGTTTTGIANAATTVTTRIDVANPAISLGIGYVAQDIPMIQSINNGTNNATNLTINPFGGNVGIGTNNPQRPLHVNGTEGAARFTSTASGNDGFEIGIGTSSQAFLWQTENAEMQFATNNSERMRIHSSGGLKFNPQSAAPTAEAGTVYYDSDDNKLKVYNGTSWVDLH